MAEEAKLGKLLFLTRSLGYGGSERQLVELAKQLRRRGTEVSVAQFYGGGPLEQELLDAGVPVVSLQKRGRWDVLGFQRSLLAAIRQFNPDILHSYLVEPNIMAALVRPLVPGVRVVWGVRAANMAVTDYGWIPRASFAASIALSRIPDLIIANSRAGATYHAGAGYPANRMMVVPNGIDTARFSPSPRLRARVRAELGIGENVLLIGNLGRPDQVKDYETFMRGVAYFLAVRTDARFVCVGAGTTAYEQSIRSLERSLQLSHAIHWVPPRVDIEALHNACDIVSSTSLSEGFPNVLAEAMSCGVPCVTTDAGDSRLIVRDLGQVVPIRDPGALSTAFQTLDAMRTPDLSVRCRKRILDEFNLDALGRRTEESLCGVFRAVPSR